MFVVFWGFLTGFVSIFLGGVFCLTGLLAIFSGCVLGLIVFVLGGQGGGDPGLHVGSLAGGQGGGDPGLHVGFGTGLQLGILEPG